MSLEKIHGCSFFGVFSLKYPFLGAWLFYSSFFMEQIWGQDQGLFFLGGKILATW
jgi:hypothetical protein